MPAQTFSQQYPGWRQRAHLEREDWDGLLPFFRQMYITEHTILRDVMEVMKEKLGFVATTKMYKTNFKRLDLWKYRKRTKDGVRAADEATTNESLLSRNEGTLSACLLDMTSGAAVILTAAGYNALNRPVKSLSTTGTNGQAEALLWHVAVHSESWLESCSNSPLPFTRTSQTWNMLMGQDGLSLSLFDVRQGIRALDQACAVVDKVMSQRRDNLLPIMLVEFCSIWWTHFADVRRSLLRYLTKLAGTRLEPRHPLTVVLFHLLDENVSTVCMGIALQIAINAAEREPPALDESALNLKHVYCGMLIDHEQYVAAIVPMTQLRHEALELCGPAGILTRCALLRQGDINIGLGEVDDAKTIYEEVLRLSEGQCNNTALDAFGIEAAARLSRVHLDSGDVAVAQKLCMRALKNFRMPFSKPGLKGAGLTLRIMLEETLFAANTKLGVHERQNEWFPVASNHPKQNKIHQLHGSLVPLSQNSNSYSNIRASLRESTHRSLSTTLPATDAHMLEEPVEESDGDQDILIRKHDSLVRGYGRGDGGGGWRGVSGQPKERPSNPPA